MKKNLFYLLFALPILVFSQNFTRQDTLRGSITPQRAWWDLTYYHLDIIVDPDNKFIKGSNIVQYRVLESHNEIQIDLQKPLKITKVTQDNKELTLIYKFIREQSKKNKKKVA